MTPKISKIFKDLEYLTDGGKNYANLRNAIKNVNPPVIPYLGMYLTDLLFLDEGNNYQSPSSNPLIRKPRLYYKC
jgi:son of sevenless-like protein